MPNIKKFVLCQIAPLLGMACIIAVNVEASNKQSLKRNIYVRGDIGYSYVPSKLNKESYNKRPEGALVGTIGSGYIINPRFRVDVTASHRGNYRYSTAATTKNSQEKQRISSFALMLNGYWSPMQEKLKRISPYLMGGAGLVINTAGDFIGRGGQFRILGDTARSFSWQLGTGLLYRINDRIGVDLMYKYIDLGSTRTRDTIIDGAALKLYPGGIRGMLKAHEVTVGINCRI